MDIRQLMQQYGDLVRVQANAIREIGCLGEGTFSNVSHGVFNGFPVALKKSRVLSLHPTAASAWMGLQNDSTCADPSSVGPTSPRSPRFGSFRSAAANKVVRSTPSAPSSPSALAYSSSTSNHENEKADYSTCEVLLKEARVMQMISHPNILKLHGVCTDDSETGGVSLVLEFAKDGSLHDLIHSSYANVGLTLDLFYGYAYDLADALYALYQHSPPIAHRDIKSHNVLLFGRLCKLGDFGSAAVLENLSDPPASRYEKKPGGRWKSKSRSKSTLCIPADCSSPGSSMPCGSTFWSAPECFVDGHAGEKSDVYSFAMLLWEMVTGSPVRKRCPPIPRHVPREISELIESCWAQSPIDRPSFASIRSKIVSSWKTFTSTSFQYFNIHESQDEAECMECGTHRDDSKSGDLVDFDLQFSLSSKHAAHDGVVDAVHDCGHPPYGIHPNCQQIYPVYHQYPISSDEGPYGRKRSYSADSYDFLKRDNEFIATYKLEIKRLKATIDKLRQDISVIKQQSAHSPYSPIRNEEKQGKISSERHSTTLSSGSDSACISLLPTSNFSGVQTLWNTIDTTQGEYSVPKSCRIMSFAVECLGENGASNKETAYIDEENACPQELSDTVPFHESIARDSGTADDRPGLVSNEDSAAPAYLSSMTNYEEETLHMSNGLSSTIVIHEIAQNMSAIDLFLLGVEKLSFGDAVQAQVFLLGSLAKMPEFLPTIFALRLLLKWSPNVVNGPQTRDVDAYYEREIVRIVRYRHTSSSRAFLRHQLSKGQEPHKIEKFNILRCIYGLFMGVVDRNWRLAMPCFEETANQGSLHGRFLYADFLLGRKRVVEAIAHFQSAAERGHVRSQRMTGYLKMKHQSTHNPGGDFIMWIESSAQRGDWEAQADLAEIYIEKQSGHFDQNKALYWARLGAERGSARCQYMIAGMHESGDFVRKDLKEAIRYYQMASRQGHRDSKLCLSRIESVGCLIS
eukprot:TRINITY_DN3996_c0_g1_i1.p1 TRINITY_DN3996_c0_g1~~TRINITY_DN3996_c0_g1_i1.p1  ORF type:complete len:970 (-),score=171.63 TRINITY_DN3996_c0_g1_i1:118-3027(-)